MSIRFDTNAAIADMHRRLVAAMVQLQGEFMREIQSGMRDTEHADSWYEGDVTEIAGVIAAEIVGGAWAAMDNFGVGSLMDGSTDNPALDEYRNSPYWNPARGDTTIRSRERGPYTTIFGETQVSRSNRGGIDLERKGGKFAPRPPSHALQTAARWMENGRMQAVVQEAMQSIPWGNYLVVDGR
jgi:hypothetical protein